MRYHQRKRICARYCHTHSGACHEVMKSVLEGEANIEVLGSALKSTAIAIYDHVLPLPAIP
jgi:hypothetical protein